MDEVNSDFMRKFESTGSVFDCWEKHVWRQSSARIVQYWKN